METASGTVMRDNVIPTNPNTPKQEAVRENFSDASRLWQTLTPNQRTLWTEFASKRRTRDPITLRLRTQQGPEALLGLSAKILQIDPTATVPLVPPTAPNPRQTVTIEVTSSPGRISFEATGTNTPNVVTEVFVQRLANSARRPRKGAYASAGFVAFSGTTTKFDVTVLPGAWACAARFVNSATGEEIGPLKELGMVSVALSVQDGGQIAA